MLRNSGIDEMIAGTDKNDPCDPNPECAACLALKSPTLTPTPTLTSTVTSTKTPASTEVTATPTRTGIWAFNQSETPKEQPGFGAIIGLVSLIAAAYILIAVREKCQ